MIRPVQRAILQRLADVCDVSDDIRIGQLVGFLPVLAPSDNIPDLGNIEDDDLLQALDRLYSDLLARRENAVEPRA